MMQHDSDLSVEWFQLLFGKAS